MSVRVSSDDVSIVSLQQNNDLDIMSGNAIDLKVNNCIDKYLIMLL